ncbi:OmpH family outer membrane protein [Candidatus Pelagibacter sp.]|nr:OmpH family outer membrane protein [Candidatus Pelagibacter sp.]
MKKLIYIIFIFIISSNTYANDNYYIDIDYILNNSNLGKLIINKLNNVNKNNLTDFKQKEIELKNLEKEISNKKNVVSEKDLNIEIDDLKRKILLFREEKNKRSKDFKDLRSNELSNFLEKITPIIENFMKENSIAIVFEKKNIFIAQSKYDITLQIIDLINKQFDD